MPAPRPDKKRRWRVSVWASKDDSLGSAPVIHKASRKREIVYDHYHHYLKLLRQGKYGRVVLHQGNLKGYSAYVQEDSAWLSIANLP